MKILDGRVPFIIGAVAGIGQASAKLFAQEGSKLALGRKMKRILLVLAVLGALGLTASNGESQSKKYLSFGSGNPSGTYYFLGAGFANIINRKVPEIPLGVRITNG